MLNKSFRALVVAFGHELGLGLLALLAFRRRPGLRRRPGIRAAVAPRGHGSGGQKGKYARGAWGVGGASKY